MFGCCASKNHLLHLGWLISLAEEKALSYGILAFEKKPAWLPAGFYPDTKPAQTPNS